MVAPESHRLETASTNGNSSEGPLLVVDGLSVSFLGDGGWIPVVDDVSFTVGHGEMVGLVGESGSGKTVTCLSITSLLPARTSRITDGKIMFDGRDLTTMPRRALENVRGRSIAMVFQEPMTSLNPAFTIGDQITEVIRRHLRLGRRAARTRAASMLDRVGIPMADRRMRSYPHEFSGGMRQRALIAMALSCEPSLLIADEPTTALDVTVQAQVLDLLRDLVADTQTSVLFVTHDLGVVAELTDRVVVMYSGQIVESAPVSTLFVRPRHPYTAALMSAMPQSGARQGRLSVIPGNAPGFDSVLPGCRFAPRCEHARPGCEQEPITIDRTVAGDLVRCARADELILGPPS